MSPVLCLSIYPVHSSILLLLIVEGKALPVLEAEFPGLCKLFSAHHTLPQKDLKPSGFQRNRECEAPHGMGSNLSSFCSQ